METISITQKQLEKLTAYIIPNEVSNTESQIYILDKGNWRYSNGRYLLKKLFITENETMANKLFTVSLLSDKVSKAGIDELVLPKHLVSVDNKIIGFTVPKIENSTNLGVMLHDIKLDNKTKIDYLARVGELLKKLKKLQNHGITMNLGDLHEYNFVVKNDIDALFAIDLDSAYLQTGYPAPSCYLYNNKNIGKFSRKYKSNEIGITYPDDNSDILCYIMMILNTIARDKVSNYDLPKYFEYMTYLEKLGFGPNILDAFEKVYTDAQNVNPVDYFDEIPIDNLGRAQAKIFELKR